MSDIISTDNTKNVNLSMSGIETIDTAFLEYVESLNTHCNTNIGWTKIPVIWSSAERSFQIKNNKEIRDKNGSLIAPIISIERTGTSKDPNRKGSFQANLSPKQDRYVVTKLLNQDKTSNFANADSLKKTGQINFKTSKQNKKQVYQSISIPIPVYITVEYKINIFTNYQSQMNEAIQPFMAKTAQNYFIIEKDNHRYECFMNPDFAQDNISNLGEEERKYKSVITVKVLGYLIGEGENQEKPEKIIEENAVEVKIPKEKIIFDSPTKITKKALESAKSNLSADAEIKKKEIKRNSLAEADVKQRTSGGSAPETEKTKNIALAASNIETIDGAFLEYVENLKLFCNTNLGWTKVPVIWSSAERSFQIKNNKEIRDKNGSLIAPMVSLERERITKDPNKKGSFQANLSPKQDRYTITKVLNQDKTSNFANADSLKRSGQINFVTSKKNKKIVYQHFSVRIPVYVTVEYKIHVLTNYQMQMNEILQPFVSRVSQNYFIIEKDGHRYESFMDQDFVQEAISNLGEEERKYKTTISIKVLGYLIGEGENREDRNINIDENAVEIKFPKEKIIIDGPKKKKKKEIGDSYGDETPATTTTGTIKKTFVIGNGSDSVYSIVHGLNTRDAYVSVRENFGNFYQVIAHVEFPTLNSIEVDVGDIIDENSHVVTIIG